MSLRSVRSTRGVFQRHPWRKRSIHGIMVMGRACLEISQGVLEMKRKPTAFTLVELLVVITIIGMLVGLLIPAVISARENARRGVCINRLREIGLAIIHFDSVKGQLPGWQNDSPISGRAKPISWAVVLFPYLDRDDLWRKYRDGTAVDASTTVEVFEGICCPSDQGNLINQAPMSYVVNNRLFLNRATTPPQTRTIESLQSAQRTVMVSERAYSSSYPVGPWTSPVADVNRLTFFWPNVADSDTVYSLYPKTNGISSNHSGAVNIAFADGHVETVPQDAMTETFLPE